MRQGGFSGGGINAITKSGHEQHPRHGVLLRPQRGLGRQGRDDRAISDFKDKQGGFSLGGPIVQNKAFFFGTADYERKLRPTGFSVNSTGQQFGNEAGASNRCLNILKNKYGYDPGADPRRRVRQGHQQRQVLRPRRLQRRPRDHQLTVRHNYIDAFNDIGSP